jgi:hypothetical protein
VQGIEMEITLARGSQQTSTRAGSERIAGFDSLLSPRRAVSTPNSFNFPFGRQGERSQKRSLFNVSFSVAHRIHHHVFGSLNASHKLNGFDSKPEV